MDISRRKTLVGFGIIFLALLLVGLLTMQVAPTFAGTIPTPIAAVAGNGKASPVVTFMDAQLVNAAVASTSAMRIDGYQAMDVQYTVLQPTSTNTATVAIQYSLDGTTWVTGTSVLSSGTTTVTGMAEEPVFGLLARIYVTCANTNYLTVTVKAMAK
jgi:hypothetical protein